MALDEKFFGAEAKARIRTGDLLDWPGTKVITIMTQGRAFGRISKEADRRGIAIPTLAHKTAKLVGEHLFVCLWDDEGKYTPAGIAACAAACIRAATLAGVAEVAFPPLGGNQGHSLLWAAEMGIFHETDRLMAEDEERRVPTHVYLTGA